jgi:acetyl esterase/lipase
MFDGMIATFPVDESYTFVEKTIGGVSGLWLDAPKKSANVMLYIHGGAMLVGNTFGYRGLSGNLAQASGVNMFSIDYRLAPEHQFPAALDDCHAAYEGLLADGYAAENISIAQPDTTAIEQTARQAGAVLQFISEAGGAVTVERQ